MIFNPSTTDFYADIKLAYRLLNKDLQRKGFSILLLFVLLSIFDLIAISSLFPFLSIISNQTALESNELLIYFTSFLPESKANNKIFVISILGVCSFIFILLSALFRGYVTISFNSYIESVRHNLSLSLFKNFLNNDFSFFINNNSSNLSKLILSETDALVANIYRPFFVMVGSFFVIISLMALLAFVDLSLAFIVLSAIFFLYGLIFVFIKSRLRSLGQERLEANTSRFLFVNTSFGLIKDIIIHGKSDFFIKYFEKSSYAYSRSNSSHMSLTQLPSYLIEVVIFGGIILISLFLIYLTNNQTNLLENTFPTLGLFALSVYRLKPAAHSFYQGLSSLKFAKPSLYDYKNHFIESSVFLNDVPSLGIHNFKSLSLENISFRYPGNSSLTLSNINLNINANTSIGIVGQSGSGKSTFINLLLGLLSPNEGSIYLNNIPLDRNTISSLQNLIGYVPQDIFLIDGSIAENIALGVEHSEIDFNSLVRACKQANIYDFICNELDDAFASNVGDNGIRLSGGQKQRIGIARALYADPEILIFDEATSALDTATENKIMNEIQSLSNSKTLFIVAHRVSTLELCDEIINIDNGVISFTGSYNDYIIFCSNN